MPAHPRDPPWSLTIRSQVGREQRGHSDMGLAEGVSAPKQTFTAPCGQRGDRNRPWLLSRGPGALAASGFLRRKGLWAHYGRNGDAGSPSSQHGPQEGAVTAVGADKGLWPWSLHPCVRVTREGSVKREPA